ncbi:MAG: glutamyl-tRNA reductase [Leptospirillia bacterium]
MNLIVVGLSHKTAPVEVREQLAFSATALPEVCRRIINGNGVTAEAMVLSTCNRVEVYAVASRAADGFSAISKFLGDCTEGFNATDLAPHLYHYPGNDAIGHMFRVASSLDSMVLGEPQILGQFKDAYQAALDAKSTGMVLNKVAKKAISVAKRVRTETRIAENAVSISFAAVELAKKVFSNLAGHKVMLLGAGEMAELALRHLVSAGASEVLVSTRTLENAERIAREIAGRQGRAVPFSDFRNHLKDVDIVICSTGADDYVLGPEEMSHAVRARKNRPVFLIDISVPRNINPAVGDLHDVYLYDVDDLQQVVDTNLEERMEEAKKAHRIVNQEVTSTARWMRSLDVVPTITALRSHAEAIARSEVEKTLSRLSHLPEPDKKTVEGLANAIVAKLLHHPMTNLRREAQEETGGAIIESTRKLFDLTLEEEPAGASPSASDTRHPDKDSDSPTDPDLENSNRNST